MREQLSAGKEKAAGQQGLLRLWWTRLNRFKPVEQEADLELDHEYDGIRELDNRLPPWWLYGFYITIGVGIIYLWRYHVAYSAPLSGAEYEISVKKADAEVKAYLAKKGETVDENTVTVSKDPADLAEGKKIFMASCVACHKADGGGMVGPNLTDDYWLHGGDVKSIFKTIKYGINAMPQWQTSYSNKQIAQVSSYIVSLQGTHPPGAKEPEGQRYKND
ncbi:MAG: c-type cytochrome [Chitinophagaceae bacterium]|nr:c-type cytochrome [Chitinophagaceae bacterium]